MKQISQLLVLYSIQPHIKGKMMLLLGAIAYPRQTYRWFRFLGSDPLLWGLAKSHARLSLKIYRPYLSRDLTCADRVGVLIEHYQLIFKAGFHDLIRKIAIRPKTVCEFEGKSGTAFQLELSAVNLDNREGELSLHLISNSVLLYRANFAFFRLNDEPHVKIGCVQGIRAADGAAHVRFTTRELYGCRPKNLMTSVIRDIGDYLGCKNMIGISNENRILAQGGHLQQAFPDYNRTWEEMGATKSNDGDFHLRCTGTLKTTFDDIPSKKRSEVKKKNALLDSIFRAVRNSLEEERLALPKTRVISESQYQPVSVMQY